MFEDARFGDVFIKEDGKEAVFLGRFDRGYAENNFFFIDEDLHEFVTDDTGYAPLEKRIARKKAAPVEYRENTPKTIMFKKVTR